MSTVKKKQYTTTAQFLGMVRRQIRSAGNRVAKADPEDLRTLIALGAELDAAIQRAVVGLRASGFTWQSIGEATGTTRQAAVMKWSKLDDIRPRGT